MVYAKIPDVTKAAIRLKYEQGLSIRQISAEYGFAVTTTWRHAKRPIPTADHPAPPDRRHQNKGRPRLVDERTNRRVLQALKSLRENEGPSFDS